MLLTITTENNNVYEIQNETKNLTILPKEPLSETLVKSPTNIDIISIPKSSPGPRGRAFVYSDFTPEQLEALTGPQGPQGEQGEKGDKGDKGDQGIQGIQGPKGDTGDRGPKGDKGDKGDQGIQGIQGPKGDTGLQGPQGIQGPQGPQGPKGDAGAVQDVQVSYDQGQTWQSAMVGSIAKILTGTGGGGGGGEMNTIEVIQKNGTNLPIVNKVVNVPVPTRTSELTNDSGFVTSSNIPQSDWNESSTTSPSYIRNKPTLVTPSNQPGPSGEVQAAYSLVSSFASSADSANSANTANEAAYAYSTSLEGVGNADDLKAIEALQGTSGLLRKTAANTWTLDTTSYAPSSSIPTKTSDLTNDSGYITLNDVPPQIQSDWNESDSTDPSYIQNKPSLAAVATSGSYNDLSNKPTIPVVPTNVSAFTNDVPYATTSQIPNVPIETISVNGVTQPIVNKNVNLSINPDGGGSTHYFEKIWSDVSADITSVEYTIPSNLGVNTYCVIYLNVAQWAYSSHNKYIYLSVPQGQTWMVWHTDMSDGRYERYGKVTSSNRRAVSMIDYTTLSTSTSALVRAIRIS